MDPILQKFNKKQKKKKKTIAVPQFRRYSQYLWKSARMEQSPFLDSSSILSRKNRDGSRSAPRLIFHPHASIHHVKVNHRHFMLFAGLFPVKRAPSIVLFRPGTGEGERGRKFHEESGAKFAFARLCWVEYPACSLNSIDSVFGVRAR